MISYDLLRVFAISQYRSCTGLQHKSLVIFFSIDCTGEITTFKQCSILFEFRFVSNLFSCLLIRSVKFNFFRKIAPRLFQC